MNYDQRQGIACKLVSALVSELNACKTGNRTHNGQIRQGGRVWP
jgi:hypothetical protein